MTNKFITFFLLYFPLVFVCQKIEDSTLISLANSEVKKNEIIFKDIMNYISRKNTEGKIFKYNFYAGNVEDYIFKPVYDSLVLRRTPDSILMKSSLLKYSYNGEEYETSKYNDAKQTIYYIKKYKNNKLIGQYAWFENRYYRRSDFQNNTFIAISKNDKNENSISYSAFRTEDFTDIIYNKEIGYDGKVEEYLYYKDFPISNKRTVIELANNIRKQKLILLVRKNYAQYTFRNKNGKFYSTKPENQYEIIDFDEISIKDHLELSILNNKETRISKNYQKDKTPVTVITTFDAYGIYWEIGINPKNADILYIEGERPLE